MRNHGFSFAAVDRLTAIHPVRSMERYYTPGFPHPVGTMATGAMANLCIFDPDAPYRVDEAALAKQLGDPYYHSAYRQEPLFGCVLFTVVNGRVWDVAGVPKPLN